MKQAPIRQNCKGGVVSMRKLLFSAAVFAAITLGGSSARADVALGAGISTLGVGGHGALEINDFLALRLNANFGAFDFSGDYGGIDYDTEVDLLTAGLLVDVHPFGISPVGGGFVITGGAYYNGNELSLTATPATPVDIGGQNFSVGSINTDVEFQEFAPYLSLGYDGTFHSIVPVSFFAKAGVLFQGAPDVTVTTRGGGVPNANLRREAQQIEDDLSAFEFYPVLSLGITIAF